MNGPLSTPTSTPEILAPAGDQDALMAALHEGADAVYFGLDEGFNARARAANFPLATLPRTVARIHRAGARAYLTMNTLVFENELEAVERILRAAIDAGVDAIIVQDPAVALLSRALSPDLPVHGSTQMTISSPSATSFAENLGISRVVLPRELSVSEIRDFVKRSQIETEVFIHGALCVSWSGQCLTSEAWGERSANRGQCAQSCRMPYDLVIDGRTVPTDDVRYLLSPKDLAGVRALSSLKEIGVHGLKIEGRQKNANYVRTAVRTYRSLLDHPESASGPEHEGHQHLLANVTTAYSRGFSDGWLAGSDHQSLVEGRFPKHRGAYLGRVTDIAGQAVRVQRDPKGRPWTGGLGLKLRPEKAVGSVASPLSGFGGSAEAGSGPTEVEVTPVPGMGVVFDAGDPENQREPGGPIFEVRTAPSGLELIFGNPGPDLDLVKIGDRVWITSDPREQRATARVLADPEPTCRIPIDLRIEGHEGAPLTVWAEARGFLVFASSSSPLKATNLQGIDEQLLREKLGALGGTPFRLHGVSAAALSLGLFLPVSELKSIRRELVSKLLPKIERGKRIGIRPTSPLPELKAKRAPVPTKRDPLVVPLVRNDAQLEGALATDCPEIELDWMELAGLGRAVARVKASGRKAIVATLRIEKPGEESFTERMAEFGADGILIRHLGALMSLTGRRRSSHPALHGDFSLNVTNSITANRLLELGLETVTASFDLDERQLSELLASCDGSRIALVIHHRMPTFHTEHCVYAHMLSDGRDFRTCGRPCDSHLISLKDSLAKVHPVIVDAGCRNTVFNADLQSSAAFVESAVRMQVARFRVEFVRESADEVTRVIDTYKGLLAGRIDAATTIKTVNAVRKLGLLKNAATLSV